MGGGGAEGRGLLELTASLGGYGPLGLHRRTETARAQAPGSCAQEGDGDPPRPGAGSGKGGSRDLRDHQVGVGCLLGVGGYLPSHPRPTGRRLALAELRSGATAAEAE